MKTPEEKFMQKALNLAERGLGRTRPNPAVGAIIVKKGAMGAEYFSSKMNISISALKKKVINSTGAGDFFNAGYLFGLINKYTVVTCLRIGVFVASKRIEQKEFFTPSKKQVNVYLKKLS